MHVASTSPVHPECGVFRQRQRWAQRGQPPPSIVTAERLPKVLFRRRGLHCGTARKQGVHESGVLRIAGAKVVFSSSTSPPPPLSYPRHGSYVLSRNTCHAVGVRARPPPPPFANPQQPTAAVDNLNALQQLSTSLKDLRRPSTTLKRLPFARRMGDAPWRGEEGVVISMVSHTRRLTRHKIATRNIILSRVGDFATRLGVIMSRISEPFGGGCVLLIRVLRSQF